MKRLVFPLLAVLMAGLALSCSKEIDPGTYRVETDDFSGILLVEPGTAEDGHASLYKNEGLLFSDPVPVTLDVTSRRVTMSISGADPLEAELTPYVDPPFTTIPEKRLYHEPGKYAVFERDSIRYGSALGFWTSYPEKNENTFLIFTRKFRELFKTLKKKDSREELNLDLDLYVPDDGGAESRPLLLLIHGGAFFNGDKADNAFPEWARYFASMGYVVASINYRMGFWPTENEVNRAGYRALQDANAAIRFLLQTDSLSIDPRLVFAAGTSAGAITALNLAYMTEGDRPPITRDGNSRYGDEGPMDAIEPPRRKPFSIRAVGNLWGAVSNTDILGNASVPVISFHSVQDPVVPYDEGIPFKKYFEGPVITFVNSLLRERLEGFDILEFITAEAFPKMYGSKTIHRQLSGRGVHSELYSFSVDRHRLHLLESGEINRTLNEKIKTRLSDFFSSEMAPFPVSLHQDPDDPQRFLIDASDVDICYWKAKGGVILEQDTDAVRVLMLDAGSDSDYAVMVSGSYRDTGMTFNQTIYLNDKL